MWHPPSRVYGPHFVYMISTSYPGRGGHHVHTATPVHWFTGHLGSERKRAAIGAGLVGFFSFQELWQRMGTVADELQPLRMTSAFFVFSCQRT